MAIRSVKELPVEGKRVFVRVDLDVPLTPARGVADDARIRAVLPTIHHLMERGARIVLGAHLGDPRGRPDPSLSLEPAGARLAELLGRDVLLPDEPVGDGARKVVSDLRDGGVALLENLRFSDKEEAGDDGFARQLAALADVYVCDALSVAHRAHASTAVMARHFADRGAGFLLGRELEFLGKLLGEVERPHLALIGGARASDKIALLEALLDRVDVILLGGAVASTFLRARGLAVGSSPIEEGKLAIARAFLKKAEEKGVAIRLPLDLLVATAEDGPGQVVPVDAIPADARALDIGPATVRAFAAEVARARTLLWNGPLGAFERKPFAAGTLALARAVAGNARATRVLVGDDTAAAAAQAGVTGDLSHVSTGGVAAIEYLEGLELPGLAALE